MELDQGFTEPAARTFSSWEKMEDFVGIRVMENPVLGEAHSGGTMDVGLPDGKGRFVAHFSPGPGHAADGVTPMDGIVAVRMYGCYSLRSGSPELHPWGGIDITVSAELAIDTENSFLDEMELLYSDDAATVQETYVTPSGLNVLISKTEIPEQEGGSVPSPAVDWYTAYFTLDGVFLPYQRRRLQGLQWREYPRRTGGRDAERGPGRLRLPAGGVSRDKKLQ